MPSHMVSSPCLWKKQGRFIDAFIQQIIIKHLAVADTFFSRIRYSLMGEKATNYIFEHCTCKYTRDEKGHGSRRAYRREIQCLCGGHRMCP